MTAMTPHWEQVYGSKSETEVSWYQKAAEPSLSLIKSIGVSNEAAIIDVGGGSSRLVDGLLAEGFSDLTVLDISSAALEIAKHRLDDEGRAKVTWIVSDVTRWRAVPARYDVWHDRAAFHFLTEPSARAAYVARLRKALKPGGFVVMGTFALDGPQRCSGLPVTRYDAKGLAGELGEGFLLIQTIRHAHRTPSGSEQRFQFSVLQLQS